MFNVRCKNCNFLSRLFFQPRTLLGIVVALDQTSQKVKKVNSSTCYSASYMRETQDQNRFIILKEAADWHELMILQRSMRPSITPWPNVHYGSELWPLGTELLAVGVDRTRQLLRFVLQQHSR